MQNGPASAPDSGKTFQHILTVAQLGAVIALIVWAVLLKRDLRSAKEELEELRRRPSPVANLQKENQSLRSQVVALEFEVASAAVAAAAKPPAATVAPAPAPANPLAALAATMNNPALRSMMAATQKRVIETRFAELFDMLQLSPEQRARFVELTSEGQSAATEAGLKMMSGNLGAAEQAAVRQQIKHIGESLDPKIRELLGDDAKFATYKQFNEQQPERTQMNALKANLAQSGQPPLSAEQSTALTAIMYSERKSFPFTPSPTGDPANPASVPSAEAMEIRMREQEQLHQRIADRAASVLNPGQLAGLRRDQARRLESLKASTEMARQLLGGAQPPAK